MRDVKLIREMIYEKTCENLVCRYIEIIEGIDEDLEVNFEKVLRHVEKSVDVSFTEEDYDDTLTEQENIEVYFENIMFNNFDWWLDSNTPEELLEMGKTNQWFY